MARTSAGDLVRAGIEEVMKSFGLHGNDVEAGNK